MNALFEQFLLEGREWLAAAGDALLRLERAPGDRDAVNALFRALHSLKGGSALFDLPAFTRLTHGGEDALSALREGRLTPSPALADRLFALLDQCARWIDRLETGAPLPDDADALARRLVAELRAIDRPDDDAATGDAAALEWLAAIDGAERQRLAPRIAAGGVVALAYDPAPDCFFSGDDPLEMCRRLPGLLHLRVEPAEPLGDAATLEPYRCVLRFRALCVAPAEAVADTVRAVPDQVRIAPVPAGAFSAPPPVPLATALLREQARILTLTGDGVELAERLPAVLRAAGNILTATGREEDRVRLERLAGDGTAADAVAALLRAFADPPPETPGGRPATPTPTRRTLRVAPERIDRIMDLAGALVAARARLPARAADAGREELSRALSETHAAIAAIAADLRAAALRLRLVPLAPALDPLPRHARDLSRQLGKEVEVRLSGASVEADKDILDRLGEPLLHLVRNAIDHGIETADVRRAAGKPAAGTIRVEASVSGGGIVVTVGDDGAGIDSAAVRAKAVQKGLIDAAAAGALSDAEALRLVFLPGFSTSAAVSDLSGRGVGMDAVRTAVEEAGGRVELESSPGRGTRVSLVLPLTAAVANVLVVEAGDGLYGVPLTLVAETARVPAAAIRRVKTAETLVHRGAVLPLLRLARLLGVAGGETARRDGVPVLIVAPGGQPVALAVDAVRERAEVVMKPMAGVMRQVRGYDGTAMLDDGRLLLILNLRELL